MTGTSDSPNGMSADYAGELLATSREVVPGWLAGLVGRVTVNEADLDRAQPILDRAATELLAQLEHLLNVDVDAQTDNPLSLFRRATLPVTEFLADLGCRPVPRDPFEVEHQPDDVFALMPATWTDIDESLGDPGLAWGAWKAMTILQRRRDEGLR